MKLTIFLAAIRTSNWKVLYDSIPQSTTVDDYELLFVGPYEPPSELKKNPKIRFVKDYGCPSRCYQLGLLHSRGEYVVFAADDGTFSPTLAIDKAFRDIPKHKKGVVSLKYFEGAVTPKSMKQNSELWWRIKRHKKLMSPYINGNYYLTMTALLRRDYLIEMGGFDCNFEHLGFGAVDLSIRLQNDGAEVILGDKFMDISHSVDHGPVFYGHTQNDHPLFVKTYSSPSSITRSRINFDNWKEAPEVWGRRFDKLKI